MAEQPVVSGEGAEIGNVIKARGEARLAGAQFVIRDAQGVVIGEHNVVHQVFQGVNYPRLRYLADVSHLLTSGQEMFVGRSEALERIAALSRQATGRCQLIEGPAGYGKTALVAKIISRVQSGAWGNLAFLLFLFRPEAEQNTPASFYRAINSQLLDFLQIEGGVPSDLFSLRAQFSQLWQQAGENASAGRPLLLIIDGLDAAQSGTGFIANELPELTGAPLHILLACRSESNLAGQVALRYGDSAEHPLRLEDFSPAEVMLLLKRLGVPAPENSELPERILKVTRGHPLMTRFVCDEISQGGLEALEGLETRPPPGITAYFQREFDQLGASHIGRKAWDMLGLLGVASGGLTAEEAAELLGIGRRSTMELTIEPIRRHLTGVQRLEIAQRQLREHLLADLYPFQQTRYRQRLLEWCDSYQRKGWPDSTPSYVLTHYASLVRDQAGYEALARLMLDSDFRQAQLDVLGDAFATLDDLGQTLELALAREDLLTALRCVAAYRDTLRTEALAQAIFDAIDTADYRLALRRAGQYRSIPNWAQAVFLFVAWEAARAGEVAIAREAISAGEALPGPTIRAAAAFRDGLLVRTARALAEASSNDPGAEAWLAQWRGDAAATELLALHGMAQPLPDPERDSLRQELAGVRQQLRQARRWSAEYPQLVEQQTQLLSKLAADQQTLQSLASQLARQLAKPYPRYRDLNVLPLAIAGLATPDDQWLRPCLRSIFVSVLDKEGIIFTFDLASILRAECERRGEQPGALATYLDQALATSDKWGTSERAHSARAAALYWQGKVDDALVELAKPTRWNSNNAGYEAITVLSLANRCIEFGKPDYAQDGTKLGSDLLEEALGHARIVWDPQFKREREDLVLMYQGWFKDTTPGVEQALGQLAALSDPDARLAYLDHVSARWSSPTERNRDGIRRLVPMALTSATTLDAVLGRLIGPVVRRLDQQQLTEAVQICADSLIPARPWATRY